MPPIPPLNLNLASSQSSEARQQSPFDSSGYSVSYGTRVPGWVWAGGLVVAALWLWRRGR